jgi:hypothetical protein
VAALIPIQTHRPSFRQRLVAAATGAAVGVAVALVAWFLSGAVSWFWLGLAGGFVGWWALDSLRPNVLWSRDGR